MLIELEGLRILTDPILVDRLMFLARVVRPVDPSLYADIDLVLLSHLHIDHFDRLSLARIDSQPEIVTCPGGASLLEELGMDPGEGAGTWRGARGRTGSDHRHASRASGLPPAIRTSRDGGGISHRVRPGSAVLRR